MNRLRSVVLALLVLACVLAAGCHRQNPNERTKVVVSIFPVYDLARRVAGPDADVTLLLQPGKNEHTFDPTPRDIEEVRAEHPGADFLIHPECGCSTSVMEYVAAGDVDSEGVHMLSTGGMVDYAEHAAPGSTVIVATEIGMLHPLRKEAPDVEFIAANERASCRYMKMITLPKLRDSLRDLSGEVKVPADVAEKARVPIERMVAINA